MRSLFVMSVFAAGGCAADGGPPPVPPAAVQPNGATVASTEVIFYPSGGQSPYQQDRDRYECYVWAVKQSGFNPSQANLEPPQRVVVRPAQPADVSVAAGAVTGAAIGAVVGSPHDEGEGAIVGAMAGAVLGSAVASSQQAQAAQVQSQYDADAAARQARLDAQAGAYRRAMSACLEGRGYTVQ